MSAPDGFTLIQRGGSLHGPASGLHALVSDAAVSFSGDCVAEIQGRIDVAANGTKFAVRRHDKGQFQLKAKALSSTRIRSVLTNGRYIGRQDGEWWIFEPVES